MVILGLIFFFKYFLIYYVIVIKVENEVLKYDKFEINVDL